MTLVKQEDDPCFVLTVTEIMSSDCQTCFFPDVEIQAVFFFAAIGT